MKEQFGFEKAKKDDQDASFMELLGMWILVALMFVAFYFMYVK